MINFEQCLHAGLSFIKRNAPTILTILGSVGVIGTGVLAAKANHKAEEEIFEARYENVRYLQPFPKKLKAKIYIKNYAPAVLVGASTIACIIGSHAISKNQQASLFSAYVMLNNAYLEFREKSKEIYGDDAEANVSKEIAKAKYDASIWEDKGVETQLFYLDSYGYFESTMEKVLQAEYLLNKQFKDEGWCNINDLHGYLDLEQVSGGEYQAWYSHSCRMHDEEPAFEGIISFLHDIIYLETGMEATLITMVTPPSYGGLEWPF